MNNILVIIALTLLFSFKSLYCQTTATMKEEPSSFDHLVNILEKDVEELEEWIENHCPDGHCKFPPNMHMRDKKRLKRKIFDLSNRLDHIGSDFVTSGTKYFRFSVEIPEGEKKEKDFSSSKKRDRANWFYLGGSMRGVTSESPVFFEGLGLVFGFSLPLLNGIDLGLNCGSLFQDGGRIKCSGETKWFLARYKRGWYLGGGYLMTLYEKLSDSSKDNFPYLTLGYASRESFYVELDLRESSIRPVAAIPEVGLRWRF